MHHHTLSQRTRSAQAGVQFTAHLDQSQQHASRRSHTHEHRVQPTSGPSREHDSFDFTGFDDFDEFDDDEIVEDEDGYCYRRGDYARR